MKQLFYSKKDETYYFAVNEGDVLKCDRCGKILPFGDIIFIHRSFTKRTYTKEEYCTECIKHHKLRVYDEFIHAEVVQMPPKNVIMVPEYTPGLQNAKNLTVFDVNEINKRGGETIDRCKVAYDPHRNIQEFALQHKEKVMQRIEKLDNPASMADVEDIFNAKPVIEHKGKKLLEKKDAKSPNN